MRNPPKSNSDLKALFDPNNYLYFDKDTFLASERTQMETVFVREKLGVDATTTLLDLACGHGRHANALARHARRVIGIDTNRRFLQMARAQARHERISNVKFVQKDIRTLASSEEYDRAMLLSTVFGLFEDEESHDLLARIHRALKPRGRICLDVVNRDTILVDFQPDYVLEKEGNLMIDRCSFNAQTGRMTNRRIYIRAGHLTNADFSLRLFNYTELESFMNAAGFEIVDAFGDWRATPFDWNSKKIVIIAAKRANRASRFRHPRNAATRPSHS